MARVKDMSGQRFGRLVVQSFAGIGEDRTALWNCVCDCGNETVVRGYSLRRGDTRSCGCFSSEVHSERNSTHGLTKTRLYKCWSGMKSRCYRKSNVAFDRYGGRGIKVCDEWRDDFVAFRNWALANDYDDTLTLDRIDTNGHYEPSNCRWATMVEQQRNRRDTVHLERNGETKTQSEWAQEVGISKTSLSKRIRSGMDVEEALTKPPKLMRSNEPRLYTFNGKTQSVADWAKEVGMNYYTLWSRLEKGWNFEKAITTKTRNKIR